MVGPLHLPAPLAAHHGKTSFRRKHRLRAAFRSVALVGLVAIYSAYGYYDGGGSGGALGGCGGENGGYPGTNGKEGAAARRGGGDDDAGTAPAPASEERRHQRRRMLSDGGPAAHFSGGGGGGGGGAEDEAGPPRIGPLRLLQADGDGAAAPAANDTKKPGVPSCEGLAKADPVWFLTWYVIGVLYMFLALAVVCDEFFVPALEEMSCERHLNLSMDVAGATLMAAGGSAPELFTSLIGTFQESSVGIGTIVGSAVFNVLFVIACCSLLSKEVLQLTWWPLFRDSTYYAVGLVVLAVFVGVVSEGIIEIWEAVVLFVMYFGYVLIMYYNRRIYKFLTKKELDGEEGATEQNGEGDFDQEGAPRARPRPSLGDGRGSDSDGGVENSLGSTRSMYGQFVQTHQHPTDFRWPGTFRAGVLKLLRDPQSWLETAGVGIVAKMAGDADHVFRTVDINGDGEVDREELEKLFSHLDLHISRDEMDDVFRELDTDGNGLISEQEFTNWYVRSEERIKSKVKDMFDHFDADNSGTIDRQEVRSLLEKLEPRVTEQDVDDAINAMYKEGSRDEITFEEFSEWYLHSIIYEEQKKKVEEDFEGVCENLRPPRGGSVLDYIKWIVVLPIVVTLVFTIPDVSRPGWGKFCYLSFVVSIAWIGMYSYFMVNWAETIGNTIGIPSVVMGLTFLAAGTSVPDLLSSVIVARKGEGDMAVSSSIGSNIFDILVGLPVPWIIFSAARGKVVEIGAKNIWINIFILLGMLVLIIIIIHCQKWKLTKVVGFMMFMFYLAFLGVAIWLETPFQVCQ